MTTCTACGKEISGLDVFGTVQEPLCWEHFAEYGHVYSFIRSEGYEPEAFDDDGQIVIGGRKQEQENGLWV